MQKDKSDDEVKKSKKSPNSPVSEKENSKPEDSPRDDRDKNGNGHEHNGTAVTPDLEEKLDLDSKSLESPMKLNKEEYTVLRTVPEYKPTEKVKPET